jgi:hypothetical protein
MAKALGQEPVQVPHCMQVLTIFRIAAKESTMGSGAFAGTRSISIFSVWFMASPIAKSLLQAPNQ